ncbi:hypothetical protein CLM84_04470, partial [Streptomyces albidoflavus]
RVSQRRGREPARTGVLDHLCQVSLPTPLKRQIDFITAPAEVFPPKRKPAPPEPPRKLAAG